ncbi:hypothetical protein LOD99_6288 [Oopsacas minuta]|uniref:DUF4371 domain-containing protein n=1 Tax=Oopsacas minuta TaxID=111878 RepID=A0AAV7JN47_9METZ|nr:hypothetical protein LOD99_6288 [Oopsacas minuta]
MCDIHHQEIKGLLLNARHFHFVIDLVLFLAEQNLLIRGHCENYSQSAKDSSDNMGNFLEMHKFILKYSPDIAKAYRNAKYKMLSPKIQNDILQAAAIALVHEIKIELMDSYYWILAEETRDSCSNELVAVCLRYLHKGNIHERAVGFVDCSSDLSAEGNSNSILLILEQLELDPDKCVGFGFDGASVMSGNTGGVQAIVRRTYIRASYVHCHSHRLNLSLQHVATKDEDLKILDAAECCTKTLQSHSLALDSVVEFINGLRDLLIMYRSEEYFFEVFKLTDELHLNSKSQLEIPELKEYTKTDVRSVEDLKIIWHDLDDNLLGEIDRRFSEDSMSSFHCTHNIPNRNNYCESELTQRFNMIIPESEAIMFNAFSQRSLVETPTLLDLTSICNPNIFDNISKLLNILVVCPVTTICVERLFSTVNLIHSSHRASMLTTRLCNLSLLSFETDITKKLQETPLIVEKVMRKMVKK